MAIKRIDPQLDKHRSVFEFLLDQRVAMCPRVDRGQILGQADGDLGPYAAGQQLLFPDDMLRIDRLHCEQVILAILEQNLRYGTRRQQPTHDSQDSHFAPNPIETAEPGGLCGRALPSLLDDKRERVFRLNAEHDI